MSTYVRAEIDVELGDDIPHDKVDDVLRNLMYEGIRGCNTTLDVYVTKSVIENRGEDE